MSNFDYTFKAIGFSAKICLQILMLPTYLMTGMVQAVLWLAPKPHAKPDTSYSDRDGFDDLSPDDIRKITVITTDEGPFVCDCFTLIETTSENIVVPMETALGSKVFDLFDRLEDVDFAAFIAAQGCTDNARFVVWQAKSLS